MKLYITINRRDRTDCSETGSPGLSYRTVIQDCHTGLSYRTVTQFLSSKHFRPT